MSTTSGTLNFLEKALVKGWLSLFDSGGPYYLPGKIPATEHVDNYPADPSDSSTTGYDLGETIPDVLSMITLGAVSMGDAQGFITDTDLTGLNNIAPNVDPNNPTWGGMTFGANDTSATISVALTKMSVSGNWTLHQPEIYVPGSGGCQAMSMAQSFGMVAGSADDSSPGYISLLKQVRTDLLGKGGNMGKWYVNQYNLNQQALQSLLTNSQWQEAVAQYNGQGVWGAILQGISSAQSGQPVAFPQNLGDDAIALVTAAQSITTDNDLSDAIGNIMNYISDYIGNDYARILQIVAGEAPPADAPKGVAAVAGAESTWANYDATGAQSLMGSWDGTFTASISSATITVAMNIDASATGTAPILTCTSFTVSIPDASWSLDYSGSGFSSDFMVWLQKTFKPSATEGINTMITSKVNNNTDIMTTITTQMNKAVASIWNPS